MAADYNEAMTEITLQIYEPRKTADETVEPKGASITRTAEQSVKPAQRTPLWQRIVWWLSLAVMLPVGLGVLQMLALLVQAERVRRAFEEALSTAQLPKATTKDSYYSLVRRPLVSDLIYPKGSKINLVVSRPFPQRTVSAHVCTRPLRSGDVVSADLIVSASTLLPRWLGPRLPFVGTDEVHVHWQVTVGQEE